MCLLRSTSCVPSTCHAKASAHAAAAPATVSPASRSSEPWNAGVVPTTAQKGAQHWPGPGVTTWGGNTGAAHTGIRRDLGVIHQAHTGGQHLCCQADTVPSGGLHAAEPAWPAERPQVAAFAPWMVPPCMPLQPVLPLHSSGRSTPHPATCRSARCRRCKAPPGRAQGLSRAQACQGLPKPPRGETCLGVGGLPGPAARAISGPTSRSGLSARAASSAIRLGRGPAASCVPGSPPAAPQARSGLDSTGTGEMLAVALAASGAGGLGPCLCLLARHLQGAADQAAALRVPAHAVKRVGAGSCQKLCQRRASPAALNSCAWQHGVCNPVVRRSHRNAILAEQQRVILSQDIASAQRLLSGVCSRPAAENNRQARARQHGVRRRVISGRICRDAIVAKRQRVVLWQSVAGSQHWLAAEGLQAGALPSSGAHGQPIARGLCVAAVSGCVRARLSAHPPSQVSKLRDLRRPPTPLRTCH